MDAREFSKAHAGEMWKIEGYQGSYNARIIGYVCEATLFGSETLTKPNAGNHIIIEPEEPNENINSVIGYWVYQFYPTEKHYKAELHPKYTEMSSCVEQIVVKPSNVKPYPSKCKRCKSPARKFGRDVMCSNVKCPVWSAVKKKYRARIEKPVSSGDGGGGVKVLDGFGRYTLSNGGMIWLDAWKKERMTCILCGTPKLSTATYAHAYCWRHVGSDVQDEIVATCDEWI